MRSGLLGAYRLPAIIHGDPRIMEWFAPALQAERLAPGKRRPARSDSRFSLDHFSSWYLARPRNIVCLLDYFISYPRRYDERASLKTLAKRVLV